MKNTIIYQLNNKQYLCDTIKYQTNISGYLINSFGYQLNEPDKSKFDEWEDLSKNDGKFRLKVISQHQNWILEFVLMDPCSSTHRTTFIIFS